MTVAYDLGGNDLIVNSITTGVSGVGSAVTSGGNIDTTNTAQTITGVKTFSANPVLTVGNTIKTNAASTTLTSNVATVTAYVLQCTTPSLSTAAAGSQTEVITLTGVAATDIVFIGPAGGTNTRKNYNMEAVCTTNTVTITIYNTEPTNAFNGTLIFNVWILKA